MSRMRNNNSWPNNAMTCSPSGNGTVGTVLERMTNRPECRPNRERMKDELATPLSSDRNAPFFPGYRPSPQSSSWNSPFSPPYPNHNNVTAAGKRTAFDHPGNLSPVITRAQAAIGKTQFEKVQNMNIGNHAGARGNGAMWPTMGTPQVRDEDSENRAKKESYRRDLERQIEQTNKRKSDERQKDRENFNHPLGPQYASPLLQPYNLPPVAPRLKRVPNPQTLCSHEQPSKNAPAREEPLISPTVNPHSSMNPGVGQSQQLKKRVSPCSPSLMKPPMNNKALHCSPQRGPGIEGVEQEYHPSIPSHHHRLQPQGFRDYQGVQEIPSPWDQNGQWDEVEGNPTWSQEPLAPEHKWNQSPVQYQQHQQQHHQQPQKPKQYQQMHQPQQLPPQQQGHEPLVLPPIEPSFKQPPRGYHPGLWGQCQGTLQHQEFLAPLDPPLKIEAHGNVNQRQGNPRIENGEGLERIEEGHSRSFVENWEERREEMSVGDSRENPLESDQGSLREKERDSVWKDEKIDPEKGENAIKQHSWQTSEELEDSEAKKAAWREDLRKQIIEKRLRDEKRKELEWKEDQRLELKFKEYQERSRRENEEENQRRPKGIRLNIKDPALNKPKEAKNPAEEITRVQKKGWRNFSFHSKGKERRYEKTSESLDEDYEKNDEIEETNFTAYPIKSSSSVSSEALILKEKKLNSETIGCGDGPKTKFEGALEALNKIQRAFELEGKRMENRLGRKLVIQNGSAEWKS